MLSALFPKQQNPSPSPIAIATATATGPQAPPIIDLNTTANKDNINQSDEVLQVDSKKRQNFFGWMFGKSSPVATPNQAESIDSSSLCNSNDKVIAMKKVESFDKEINEEFIDIQIRRLSYAEVAALSVPSKDNTNKLSSRKIDDDFVIDQELELEKSVTDLEFADNYSNVKKFNDNREDIEDLHLIEEFDDDDVVLFNGKGGKKMPRRFVKNGKYLKKRDVKS
ncbi:hypothetical protein CANARDRAFT_28237 [[Candida] arabinofermentans NRRL YB-2248]|uniref:Uncharacterized protein n=1 Tax=[Candida] arabinofermentans NRRL YB-2248 TaxID=983967 RepID=A0A1E4T113_9ASCO|nr:hypothetical protein CANARDRAFT_28237 [[Candida] arabinofermentans NRRL YB-2248]